MMRKHEQHPKRIREKLKVFKDGAVEEHRKIFGQIKLEIMIHLKKTRITINETMTLWEEEKKADRIN